jgi:hypothetical protein
MAILEDAPMISAATTFSQYLANKVPLTEAFNDSKLGQALETLFGWPHAKVYQRADKGLWYVPSHARVNLPKDAQHIADTVFFDKPRDRNSVYFIERAIDQGQDGQSVTTYTLCLQNRETHGNGCFADTIATISGVWAAQVSAGRSLKDVKIVNNEGYPAAIGEYIFTLDQLLKSEPLARNPLWTAPKP